MTYTDNDLAYLAGLLDGEGHFGGGYNYSRRTRQGPKLQITMTDRGAVEWVRWTFGGRLYNNGRAASGKPVYGWILCRSSELRQLLRQLLPHLKVKSSQAWALLRVVEVARGRPNHHGRPVSKEERPLRKAVRERCWYDLALARHSVTETRRVPA